MSGDTSIEWTDKSWNPTTGCTQVSPGCAHCYAKTLTERFHGPGSFDKVVLHPDRLEAPFGWRKPARVFVNSMSDLFHEDIPDEFIDRVFAVMARTPQHTYQVLTKRPERMREYVKSLDEHLWRLPLSNVWLGVTVENQHWADERIPYLLETPAVVRFLSAEPLLGPLVLDRQWTDPDCIRCGRDMSVPVDGGGVPCPRCFGVGGRGWQGTDPCRVSWVIIGGESGPKHRPFEPDWARALVRQCRDAGIAPFVKQLGGARPGNRIEDLPEDLRVREYPA